MTITTISGQVALWRVAEATQTVRSVFVTTAAGATALTCAGEQESTDGFYNHALASIPGKGLATVANYAGATRTFTLAAPGLAGAAAGDVLMLAWWNPDARARAWAAVNRAIDESWPDYWIEHEVSAAQSGITLAAGATRYPLPADVGELFEIGVTVGGGDLCWLAPLDIWRQAGTPGAYELVFRSSQSNATAADAWTGSGVALRYAVRAAPMVDETGTTPLPAWYFDVAAARYREAELNEAVRSELSPALANLPLLQRRASEARARLASLTTRLRERRGPQYSY